MSLDLAFPIDKAKSVLSGSEVKPSVWKQEECQGGTAAVVIPSSKLAAT